MTSEEKLARLATAKQQQTEIFSPRVLSGNGLLSQRLSQRQVRGQMTRPHSACYRGTVTSVSLQDRRNFWEPFPTPHLRLHQFSFYNNVHIQTAQEKLFPWVFFTTPWFTLWSVWGGNAARSLINAVSQHSLQWLLLNTAGIAMLPPEPHFSISHSISWGQTSLIVALRCSKIRTPYPASSWVKRWSSLFRTSVPFLANTSNKILVAKLFYCQGAILLGLKLLLAFGWVLLNNKACVIKQSVNFTARVWVWIVEESSWKQAPKWPWVPSA